MERARLAEVAVCWDLSKEIMGLERDHLPDCLSGVSMKMNIKRGSIAMKKLWCVEERAEEWLFAKILVCINLYICIYQKNVQTPRKWINQLITKPPTMRCCCNEVLQLSFRTTLLICREFFWTTISMAWNKNLCRLCVLWPYDAIKMTSKNECLTLSRSVSLSSSTLSFHEDISFTAFCAMVKTVMFFFGISANVKEKSEIKLKRHEPASSCRRFRRYSLTLIPNNDF